MFLFFDVFYSVDKKKNINKHKLLLDFITSCKLCQEFIASSKMAEENKSYPFQCVINTYFHTSVISAWKAQQIWGLKNIGKNNFEMHWFHSNKTTISGEFIKWFSPSLSSSSSSSNLWNIKIKVLLLNKIPTVNFLHSKHLQEASIRCAVLTLFN